MQGTITFYELAMLLLFLLLFGIGTIAILVLIKLNELLKKMNAAVRGNLEHMNRVIPNLAEISDHTLETSREMRVQLENLESLPARTYDTATAFHANAQRIGDYAVMIDEFLKMLSERLGTGQRS